MTASDYKRLSAALEANWQAKIEGRFTYTALAAPESDPQRHNALGDLAAGENTMPISAPSTSLAHG